MGEEVNTQVRQEAIKKLLSQKLVSDQKKLVELLKENFGIETNQSVVCRDLRKLGATKKEINQDLFYELPNLNVTTELLKLAIVDIQHNEMLIVIKTHPGLAAFVGDCLDQNKDLEILGCLAGENVVFATPITIKKIKEIYMNVCERLHFKSR